MKKKIRLDVALQEKYSQLSRNQIQSFIMQGKVTVNDKIVTKSGTQVCEDYDIAMSIDEPKYVSRAGAKLECALDHFDIKVEGLVALDAGISTGGFADCLLQRGVAKLYGVDVGYGLVHEKVKNNSRVVIFERTNFRSITKDKIGELVDIVTLDLSFISVLKVLDSVCSVLKCGGRLVVLVKPQFEAGREDVGKGGIIKDSSVHEKVIEKVKKGVEEKGFSFVGVVPSSTKGSSGNQEFLAYFRKI